MNSTTKKLFLVSLFSGLVFSSSTFAWYDDHYYYHHHGNGLAAGLLVGGAFGLVAGAAIADSSRPVYVSHYYEEGPRCYRVKAWDRRFCDDEGCYIKTAWRTVCDY
jgi:hypothetical protein